MRWPIPILIVLIVALQYPLWLGRGGWYGVREIDKTLQAQRVDNDRLEQCKVSLEAEVNDLKTGDEAIEEQARFDLGLVRPGELFVRIPRAPSYTGGGTFASASGGNSRQQRVLPDCPVVAR